MNTQQRTPEWYRARLGKITGSAVGDIISKGKGAEFTKTGLSYLNSVAAERLLQSDIIADDEYFQAYLDEVNVSSKAMRIGTEREAEARELYSIVTNRTVDEVGSIEHPTIAGFASSPDGIVTRGEEKGTLEIKCPTPATYISYLSGIHSADDLKAVNPGYYWQCFAHMAVTGALWCDFVAYCPYLRVPIHIVRIARDEEVIDQLLERVRLALQHIDSMVADTVKDLPEPAATPEPPSSDQPDLSDNSDNSSACRISRADLAFLVDPLLPKLIEAYPIDNDNVRDCNLIRRAKLLLNKLSNKLNKSKQQ
ncbi:MAG: lambda exonuclease family protein [Muribaculaceae bacterium]